MSMLGPRCGDRAVAYLQFAGAAIPACKRHASKGRPVEAITRLRPCAFDREPSAGPRTTFDLVIAEAVSRCDCGAHATICTCCALVLRPLARTRPARREPLARQA